MGRQSVKYFIIFSLLMLSTISIKSQLIVENTMTVEQYVQDVLLGSGVSVSNITFNGSSASSISDQVGYFNSASANVGMNSGMILASGLVVDAVGPNNSGSFGNTVSNSISGDSDLETLLPGYTMNDVAVLEFDFIPNGDTLSFEYVFGSEEYLEWVGSSFNDVFGFFLCGPGITGPYSTPSSTLYPGGASNLAIVPSTSLAVAIDNVNSTSNSAYYVDNGDGFTTPNSSDPSYIQYDGLTTPLQAFALVQCGETYHIKIAIADAGDSAYDSGVFLQEGSFSSSLAIQTELSINVGTTSNILYENCGEGVLIFTRYGDFSNSAIVELVVSGVAINGVDYTTIPSQVVFASGDSVTTLAISAIPDGVLEGFESVTIDVTNTATSACGVNVTTQFTFDIADDPDLLSLVGDTYSIICGDSVLIGNLVTGGYGSYSYIWYANGVLIPEEQDSMFYASPGVTTDYLLHVDDICNAGSIEATYTVNVPVYPPLAVDIDPSMVLLCLQDTVISVNTASGGDGNYNYNWYQDVLMGTGNTLNYTAYNSNQLVVELIDGCGLTTTDTMQINVPIIPIVIDITPDQSICKGDRVDITSNISGGQEPYVYLWNTGASTDSISVAPQISQQYSLTILDQCFNTETNETNITVSDVNAVFTLSMLEYYGVDVMNHSSSVNGGDLSYVWDFGDGFESTQEELTHMYTNLSDHTILLIATNDAGCTDSIAHDILAPRPIYVPNAFTPNEDGINDLFSVTGLDFLEYEINIFDRLGQVVYHSFDIKEKWNGGGARVSDYYTGIDVYDYLIEVRTKAGEKERIIGSVTVIR